VWRYLSERGDVDMERIAVYGRSVGSAIGLHLATTRPVRAVILDSPFSSGREMAARHYKFLPRFLNRTQLDNVARARELRVPLLVIHGAEDFIAPVGMGAAVAEAGRAERMIVLENTGHNDTYNDLETYRRVLHGFLNNHLLEH
jgi:uncharacterized protein